MKRIYYYIKSMRLLHMLNFVSFIFGYFLNKGDNILLLIATLFCFGPLLYGGIYIINDLFDIKEDKKDPIKRNRPIAKGIISFSSALITAILMIIIAIILLLIINPYLAIMALVLLLIAVIYSWILKKINYIEFIGNGLSHPLKFYSGILLAGSIKEPITCALIAAAIFLLAVIGSIAKRMNKVYRKNKAYLSRYKIKYLRYLSIAFTVLLFIAAFFTENYFVKITFLIFCIIGLIEIVFYRYII